MTTDNFHRFLKRFSTFYDSVVRQIDVHYRSKGKLTTVSIVISARDLETSQNEGWVNVSIRIDGVTDFRFCEGPKESYQVLSDGLKIIDYGEKWFFDFGDFDEPPKDLEKLKSSRFFVIGSHVSWEVLDYSE